MPERSLDDRRLWRGLMKNAVPAFLEMLVVGPRGFRANYNGPSLFGMYGTRAANDGLAYWQESRGRGSTQ
jgi:hypothetical protein